MLFALALAHAADAVPAVAVDGQLYRPPQDASATLWTDDAGLRPGLRAGATVGWVHEPVVWVWQDSGERVPVVGDAVGLDLLASYTFWRIRAGLDVPVYPYAAGSSGSGGGVGDIAVDLKGVLLESDKAPVGLAISFRGDLPTSSTAVPLAADGFAYELAIIADKKLGPVLVAINLGTRGLPAVDAGSVDVGDQLAWRVGAGYDPGGKWGASLDLAGYATWNDLGNPAGAPAEAMIGGWVQAGDAVRLSLGLGHGITEGIGASNGRAVLGVQWAPGSAKPAPHVDAVKPVPKPVAKKPDAVVVTPLPPPVKAPVAVVTPLPVKPPVAVVTPPPPPVVAVVTAPAVRVATATEPVIVIVNRVVLYQRVTFEGAMLTTSGAAQLDAVGKYLQGHPEIEHIRVEGHTAGTGDASEELGIAGSRAGLVLDYLERKGLDRARFTAAGYGSMRPLVPGTDEAARMANERIEFVVTKWAEGSAPK